MRFGLALGTRTVRRQLGTSVFACLVSFLFTLLIGTATALPNALSAADRRDDNRAAIADDDAPEFRIAGKPAYALDRYTVWRGQRIRVIEVDGARSDIAPPPGVERLPSVGHSVVSPALLRLRRSVAAQRELEPRVPSPVATIAAAGLRTPSELLAYVGVLPDPVEIKANPASLVTGWGYRDSHPRHERISPLTVAPVVLLTLIPSVALLAGLLRLDVGRRRTRRAVLASMGASRPQRAAVDVVLLGAPLTCGSFAAVALAPVANSAFADRLLDGRLFFGHDLAHPLSFYIVAWLAVLSLTLATAMKELDAEETIRRARGKSHVRVFARLAVGSVLLASGIVAVAVTTAAPVTSFWRSYGGFAIIAALLLCSSVVLLPALVIAGCRTVSASRLAGVLASARIHSARSTWRNATATLTLTGIVAGMALAALTILDASTEVDELLWMPDRLPPHAVMASASPAKAVALATELRGLPIVPIEDVRLSAEGGSSTPGRAVAVRCADVGHLLELRSPTGAECATAWVVDPDLTGLTVQLGRAALTLRSAGSIPPVELFLGTETVIVPMGPIDFANAVHHTSAVDAAVVIPDLGHSAVEALRNDLWHSAANTLSGGSAPLSSVVTREDLLRDSESYVRTYGALVSGLIVTTSLASLLALALAAGVLAGESRRHDQLLTAMGASSAFVRAVRRTTTLIPASVAVGVGFAMGTFMGSAYLGIGGYSSLDGWLNGFPLRRFALLCGVEIAVAVVLLSSAIALTARFSGRLDAGSLHDA